MGTADRQVRKEWIFDSRPVGEELVLLDEINRQQE
jgi:hypothetical protein